MQNKPKWHAALIFTFLGAGLVALGIVRTQPKVYIAGVALLVITVCLKMMRTLHRDESSGRPKKMLVPLIVIGLGASAIVIPRNAAQARTEPDDIWSARIQNAVDMALHDRVLLTRGAVALSATDLETGELLWEHTDSNILQIHISNDGHVLARGKSLTWLAPDGEKLWERKTDEYPVAAAGDVVVLRDCDADVGCEFRGIDREENIVFEYGTDGDPLDAIPYWLAATKSTNIETDRSRGPSPIENLPMTAVIEADDAVAVVLNASTGKTVEIDSMTPPAVSGDTIMHQISQDADAEVCEMAGTRADGEEFWREEMPCSAWGIVIEDRYYGAIPNADDVDGADGEDKPLQDTLTVDLRTGKWRQHKPAMNWNEGHDSQTSVLGADMIIERNEQQLTAIDPDTGDELWRTTVPGTRMPGVYIAHGEVATLNRGMSSLNPFTDT